MVVTDADGDSAPAGNLVINIVDDVPTAVADTDSVAAGTSGPVTGNVLTAAPMHRRQPDRRCCGRAGRRRGGGRERCCGRTNANLDDPTTLAGVIQGSFGELTLAADGGYSYTRDAGTAGGVNDVFTYTLTDGDGDLSPTTLTIAIGDSTPTDAIPAAGGATTTVFEAAFLRVGRSPRAREIADGNSTTTRPVGDGVGDDRLHLAGRGVGDLAGRSCSERRAADVCGRDDRHADGVVQLRSGDGRRHDLLQLYADRQHGGRPTSASFAVVVTDADGDSAPAGNLVINIVDDVPTAVADTDAWRRVRRGRRPATC